MYLRHIQPNNSKRKLKTARNSTPRKVAKTARLLNNPEDEVNPPKADLPIREVLENQSPLLGKEEQAMNIDNGNFVVYNTQPILEVMDNAQLLLEGNPHLDNIEPVLEDNSAVDHIELVLEDNPAADHIKLEGNSTANHVEPEGNPAADNVKPEDNTATVELDNNELDAVVVDNYEEPEKDEKEEFYPNKAYARKMLNHDKYAVNHVGDQIYNPLSKQYASYLFEEDGVTHKVQFVPRNANGSFNFLKDNDGMVIYPFNLAVNFPIFPQNHEGEYTYFRINNIDHYPRNAKGKPIYVKNKKGREVLPFNGKNVHFYA
ncbi:hypothetical protein TNIN_184041 [Trichonephila inaurata madagascariensis]|uniref:Uncharacterized protein n=1 Tax=Trichonephila inaurata madagascariensis TaxID=2747483 RepID=A0A8X7CF20_9ARAC|nr:hypothetical protein TNIN_184041 [Trichonephila inaurata madagascariensis]